MGSSSKVLASPNSTPNSDHIHQQLPLSSSTEDQFHTTGTFSGGDAALPDSTTPSTTTTTTTPTTPAMDEFLSYICTDSTAPSSSSQQYPCPNSFPTDAIPARDVAVVSDEVWREAEMTLEDFLTKADDDRIPPPHPPQLRLPNPTPPQCFDVPPSSMVSAGVVDGIGGGQFHAQFNPAAFGDVGGGIVGGGRLKRRSMAEDVVIDKVTQQKHKRMIKNRESAARSRERKQAYTVELEARVKELEEEKARLQLEEVEKTRERLKQLMENLITVVEKRRPRRAIRKVNSMEW